MAAIKQQYYAAIYCRLSKEDGDKEESNSITNQKSIIYDFLKYKSDIEVVSVRIDDGYSGKNFDRPGFQNMMDDVRQKKVNCIIVKDLSRFARNYIDAGQYLEYDFPKMGVRFIAINDNVDSAKKHTQNNDIIVPFKNLMNEFYLGDISRKTRASLEIKRKKGDFVSAFSVYGYKKDEQNKNKLVIDDYAAGIIKEIFQLKLYGKSNSAIANQLNHRGVPSPLEYKNLLGIRINSNLKTHKMAKWYPQTIEHILKNEIYTGVLEQGKVTTINYKLKKQIKKAKSQWIRIESTHQPIVPKWLFKRVNNIMKTDTRAAPGLNEVYLFSGILYCADCQYNLVRSRIYKNGKEYAYFICPNHKKNKKICSSHRISESELKFCVSQTIKQRIKKLIDLQETLAETNLNQMDFIKISNAKKEISDAKAEINYYENKCKLLSAKLYSGVIDKMDYADLKKIYTMKINQSKEIILHGEKEINKFSKYNEKKCQNIDESIEKKDFMTLHRGILVTFIDKILVYEGNKIKIIFSFKE